MLSNLALAAAAVAFMASPALATINTPSGMTTCQPSLLEWTASTAPYYLTIIPGNQQGGAVIRNLGQTSDLSMTYVVDLAPQSITLALKDGTGATIYSGAADIVAGPDTSCVKASSSSGTVASGSSAASSASAGATGAAASAASSGSAKASSVKASASAAAASVSSTVSSSSSTAFISVGAAALGLVGAGAAYLL